MGYASNPVQAVITDISELRRKKTQEIRRVALRLGEAGVSIIGCVDPLMSFRMAITPDDVNLLKQANEVAKLEEELI